MIRRKKTKFKTKKQSFTRKKREKVLCYCFFISFTYHLKKKLKIAAKNKDFTFSRKQNKI